MLFRGLGPDMAFVLTTTHLLFFKMAMWRTSHQGLVEMKHKADQNVQGTEPITRSFALNQKNAAATVATFPATNANQILLSLLHWTGQF